MNKVLQNEKKTQQIDYNICFYIFAITCRKWHRSIRILHINFQSILNCVDNIVKCITME